MERCYLPEIIDSDLPEDVMRDVHRDLTRTHRLLGNTAAILAALRRDPLPVRRVLDIGCGDGALLLEIQRKLRAEVMGVDLRPPSASLAAIPFLQTNAVLSPLPKSDVAIAVCMVHHISDSDCTELIRNVGRYCRRFIILDLVRHRLPLTLFRLAMGSLLHAVNVHDGCRSIRRSHTPRELSALVTRSLQGTGAVFQHRVAPFYTRQIIDITYGDGTRSSGELHPAVHSAQDIGVRNSR